MAAPAPSDPVSVPDETALFRQLDEYAWAEDEEFQGGLSAILGAVTEPAQLSHLTLRAKCYYFARKAGVAVDFNAYKAWVESQRVEPHSATPDEVVNGVAQSTGAAVPEAGDAVVREAPKPASFAEICEMIADGRPIPGIKDIPDTILEGQASESRAEKRRKPWEANGQSQSTSTGGQPSWLS